MMEMRAVVVPLVGFSISLLGCQKTTVGGVTFSVDAGKPYTDYEDLKARRVPTYDFSMTGYQLESNSTIDFRFYTHGKPEDRAQIDPTIKTIKYLTQNLNREHPIHLVFYDGNPHMTSSGKPVGTGEVIREVTLPVAQ